jgi:hypothetical protein
MDAYRYPSRPHRRKHGPRGYHNAIEYRPWLRDEFAFRCVFCLEREQWVNRIGHFHGDHFRPVADRPDLTLEYDNLLYVCQACNLRKGKERVPDPLSALVAGAVLVYPDGAIRGRTLGARRLIEFLRLDGPSYRRRRRLIRQIIDTAARHKRLLYVELMGFPQDLPDLSKLKPPGGNSRPSGIDSSYHARRSRGKLPKTY